MDNIFRKKSFDFAVRIVKLYKYLCEEKKEYVMSKQLLKAGTSIGSNHREAECAESKSDFIHKMAIVQKESNETCFWLELLYATDYLAKNEFENINADAVELLKMATSSIKTAKSSLTTNH